MPKLSSGRVAGLVIDNYLRLFYSSVPKMAFAALLTVAVFLGISQPSESFLTNLMTLDSILIAVIALITPIANLSSLRSQPRTILTQTRVT